MLSSLTGLRTSPNEVCGLAPPDLTPEHEEPHRPDDPALAGAFPDHFQLSESALHLLDLIDVGVWVVDVNGRIVLMNAAAERMHGRARAEVIGRHFTEFVAPDRLEVTLAQFQRKIERAAAVTDYETAFVDPRGRRSTLKIFSIPLRRDRLVVGVLAFAYPISPASQVSSLPQRWPVLSPRREQILKLVAAGRTTSEISRELVLSEQTVRNHIRDVLRELHAHSRLEAVDVARRLGLLCPEPVERGLDG